MKIKFLRLYKTPLDPAYNNVYDDYTSISDYLAFLDSAFSDYFSITISEGYKSRKDENGDFTLVLSGYDSMALHDYNYMAIQLSNNSYKFAFITSVESMNDNQASSCMLYCKLDAWTENYLSIKAKEQGYIEKQCTIDGHQSQYSRCFDKSFTPSAYKTNNVHFMSTELIRYPLNNIPSGYQAVPNTYSGKLRILWLRVKCDPYACFDDQTHNLQYNDVDGTRRAIFQGSYPDEQGILMVPVAIYIGSVPLSFLHQYGIDFCSVSGGNTIEKEVDYQSFPKLRNILYGQFVYSAEYTFFPPFHYNI